MAEEARKEGAGREPPPPPSYLERRKRWHENPGVFTFKMARHPYSGRMYQVLDGFGARRLSQPALVEFRQTFYSDPDPMAEGLRQVRCPSLVLIGEYDYTFIKPSELMAKEIPDNRHVVMRGLGHMTAIEAPVWTAHELLDFLECVASTGKANR